MNKRMRIMGWTVVPNVVIDDGDNLDPQNVNPISIKASEWDEFKNGGDEKILDQIREQIEVPVPTNGKGKVRS